MKKNIKKVGALGLALSLIMAGSLTVKAAEATIESASVSGWAGDTYFSGNIYADAYTAGAQMTANDTCDLYIKNGYAEDYYGDTYSFSKGADQNTYVSEYCKGRYFEYASANFECSSNDGGYNKIYRNVAREPFKGLH